MTGTPTELRDGLPPEILSERKGRRLISPRTTEELAAAACYAHGNNLALEIMGNGTKRRWGNPVEVDVALDITGLHRVLEHPWQDLTCTVEAGCVWADLQQRLAQHNQFVALDPLWPGRATVGGIVSTNDSGALRHRYGSLRDLVIGMTLVLADGTMARTGGKVVKNVAGYDLHKLMTGAFGTLAIIADVTFRLHPLPLHAETFTVSAPRAGELGGLMAAIRDSHLLTQGLQLRGDVEGFHLDIQLNAHPEAGQSDLLGSLVDACAAGMSVGAGGKILNSRGLGHREMASDPGRLRLRSCPIEDFRSAREALFESNATVVKLSVGGSEVCEYLDQMQTAREIEVACVAQSSGLIFASLAGDDAAIESYLRGMEADYAILATPLKLDHWKADPNSLPLMREIKRQFDPKRMLNPGRLIGGI